MGTIFRKWDVMGIFQKNIVHKVSKPCGKTSFLFTITHIKNLYFLRIVKHF